MRSIKSNLNVDHQMTLYTPIISLFILATLSITAQISANEKATYTNKTKKKSRVGPVYVVDLSKENRYLALMIYSGYGALASESAKSLAQGMIDSLRLLL